MLDRDTRDGVETGGSDVADGVLVKDVVEEGHGPDDGEVVQGLVGVGQGSVKVVSLLEVADGLGEGDGSNNIPGV